jgi:hypothetical protein
MSVHVVFTFLPTCVIACPNLYAPYSVLLFVLSLYAYDSACLPFSVSFQYMCLTVPVFLSLFLPVSLCPCSACLALCLSACFLLSLSTYICVCPFLFLSVYRCWHIPVVSNGFQPTVFSPDGASHTP